MVGTNSGPTVVCVVHLVYIVYCVVGSYVFINDIVVLSMLSQLVTISGVAATVGCLLEVSYSTMVLIIFFLLVDEVVVAGYVTPTVVVERREQGISYGLPGASETIFVNDGLGFLIERRLVVSVDGAEVGREMTKEGYVTDSD